MPRKNLPIILGAILIAVMVASLGAVAAVEGVDEGNEKVVKYKGDAEGTFEPGSWYVINPITQSTVSLDTRPQKMEFTDVEGEGARDGDNRIKVITADNVRVPVNLHVSYKITDSQTFYETWKNHQNFRERALRPGVEDGVLEVGGGMESNVIATDEGRSAMRQAAKNELEERASGTGATITSVSIEKVELPNEITSAAERAQAKDQALEAKKKEKAIAREEAERKRIEAEGERDARMIRAEAYQEEGVLQAMYIEKLDETDTVYIPVDSNGTPKFIESRKDDSEEDN